MVKVLESPEKTEIFEFQGEFEHLELFDGVFDEESLRMKFKGFVLQGRREKKEFTVFEKNGTDFNQIAIIQEIVLFDKPPKFNF